MPKGDNLEQENILFGSLPQPILEFSILSLLSECSNSSYGVPHPESNRILALAFKALSGQLSFLTKNLSFLLLTTSGISEKHKCLGF